MRYMYDSINPNSIPANATVVAGYEDGLYANMGAMLARFPSAVRVGIAVFASTNGGQVLDVETGDATPSEAPGWVQRRRTAGVDPTVYCNTGTWPAVRAAFHSAGVAEPHYWIALYDGDPTIPAGAIAKQYQSTAGYDLSSVAAYWPGVDSAPPPTPQELDMPKWNAGPIVPGPQPTVVLPPSGAAWTAYPHRALHLGMDQIGTPDAKATVRVWAHNGAGWSPVAGTDPKTGTVTVLASGGRVDLTLAADVQKISLQSVDQGVSYAVETW